MTDDEINKLMDGFEKLAEALKFYARPDTYFAIAFLGDPPCGEFINDCDEDHGDKNCPGYRPGKLARQVLDEMNIDWYDE